MKAAAIAAAGTLGLFLIGVAVVYWQLCNADDIPPWAADMIGDALNPVPL